MEKVKQFIKKNFTNPTDRVELTVYSLRNSKEVEKILNEFKVQSITVREDSSLLGGFILKVKDKVLDLSLKEKLKQLEAKLGNIKYTDGIKHIDSLKGELNSLDFSSEETEVGEVVSIKDGVCIIDGLENVLSQELLLLPDGTSAVAFNLDETTVGAMILGRSKTLKVGDIVKRTNSVISVPVGNGFLGRVIDPLGTPIDSTTAIKSEAYYPIEKKALGVLDRQPVTQPLQTGIKAIDTLVPIGKGQRELILGDRQTGKTAVAIDTIINQKDSGVISIYVAIGQKLSKVAHIVEKLKANDALKNTIIVASGASDPASLLYLAPYSAVAMAEYFADQGKDVLVVYDDLTKHAIAYREISLILRRPPGREAFPGDVFFLHSRLLERAAKYSEEKGGGSITALPIIETQAGDISAYIPTNVISITDGQIFLESNLFNKGIRPAINVGLSVSRVGGSAQTKAIKKVAGKMKISLAQYRELEAFSQFSGDLDETTKQQLNRGKRTVELLKQKQGQPYSLEKQVLVIAALNSGYFDNTEVEEMSTKEKELVDYANKAHIKTMNQLKEGQWSDEIEKEVTEICEKFFKNGK